MGCRKGSLGGIKNECMSRAPEIMFFGDDEDDHDDVDDDNNDVREELERTAVGY